MRVGDGTFGRARRHVECATACRPQVVVRLQDLSAEAPGEGLCLGCRARDEAGRRGQPRAASRQSQAYRARMQGFTCRPAAGAKGE